MMQLCAILLVLSTASASWFSPDSKDLKRQVFTHTYELYMDDRRKEYASIGDRLIDYGWAKSGCLSASAANVENSRAVNSFPYLKSKYNMEEATFIFYNYFLAPEKDKDLLLSMISVSADEHMSFTKTSEEFVIKTGECEACDFRFPEPTVRDFRFSGTDCEKIKLFVERLRYRMDNYRYEFEYYALMVFALTNFQDVEDEIDEVAGEKLNNLIDYLSKASEINGYARLENTFCEFLVFRNRKQGLMQTDIDTTKDATVKEGLEEQLKQHQLMTHMMLHGWMIIYTHLHKKDLDLTDGKLWLTDSKLQKHVFDVPLD